MRDERQLPRLPDISDRQVADQLLRFGNDVLRELQLQRALVEAQPRLVIVGESLRAGQRRAEGDHGGDLASLGRELPRRQERQCATQRMTGDDKWQIGFRRYFIDPCLHVVADRGPALGEARMPRRRRLHSGRQQILLACRPCVEVSLPVRPSHRAAQDDEGRSVEYEAEAFGASSGKHFHMLERTCAVVPRKIALVLEIVDDADRRRIDAILADPFISQRGHVGAHLAQIERHLALGDEVGGRDDAMQRRRARRQRHSDLLTVVGQRDDRLFIADRRVLEQLGQRRGLRPNHPRGDTEQRRDASHDQWPE